MPLPYAGKVSEFARAVGIPTPASLGRDAVGPLLSAIDRLWDEREEYRRRTRRRIEKLRPRSAATLQSVLDVLHKPLLRAAPTVAGEFIEQEGTRRAPVDPTVYSGAADPAPALSAAGG